MDTPRIFPQKIFSSGLSLIEVLIVVSLIAALAVFALPRLRLKTGNIKTSARELNQVMRSMRLMAKTRQATYRLVFDLSQAPHTYWLETTSQFLGPDFWKKSAEEKLAILQKESSDEEEAKPLFEKDTRILKKEKTFSPDVTITEIETQQGLQKNNGGLATLYCFKEGICESAVIRMTNQYDKILSLYVEPLTGAITLFEKNVQLTDFEAN